MSASSSQDLPLSPTRKNQQRIALAEQSSSQANKISARLVRDSRNDPPPFGSAAPTLHPSSSFDLLYPSAIRKHNSGHSSENEFPILFAADSVGKGGRSTFQPNVERPRTANAPTLTLKRSVATLRDMYEAQSEKSRPSTAASPQLRPSTSNSRLRSWSSTESFSGEPLHKITFDDFALLPSMSERLTTLKKIESQSSLDVGVATEAVFSSPNFVTIGASSSSENLAHKDHSSLDLQTADTTLSSETTDLDTLSSPNVTRLGSSSSFDATDEQPSSPNVVKLGSSSPSRHTTETWSTFPTASSSPDAVHLRKRKQEVDVLSFATRAAPGNPVASNPSIPEVDESSPIDRQTSFENYSTVPSSPPRAGSTSSQTPRDPASTPCPGPGKHLVSESDSLTQSHANLQVSLGSSPAAHVLYPIVRAPRSDTYSGISIPKRPPRAMQAPGGNWWSSRLSTVPSEFSGSQPSKRSSFVEDFRSDSDSDVSPSMPCGAANEGARQSSVRMVSDADRQEATDSVTALPRSRPPIQPRSSSFMATQSSSSNSRLTSVRTSLDNRLNSMKSYTNSHHNSMRSNSYRPGSSGSGMSSITLPAWARRYYSGVYQETFQAMYSFVQVGSSPNLASGRPSMTFSRRTSMSSRSRLDRFPFNLINRPSRPHLESRRTHLEPGLGPLVSHPVRPTTAQAIAQYERTIRTVSVARNPADPRAHWAGAEEDFDKDVQPNDDRNGYLPVPRNRTGRASEWSPHLHQDSRANGHPRRSLWRAPSLDERREKFFDLRNVQVLCFIGGFIFPLAWFTAAFIKLPPDPEQTRQDEEKAAHGIVLSDSEIRLRRQIAETEEIRFENARWWRGLNRFMCAVGAVIIAIVVTLAILGTKKSRSL